MYINKVLKLWAEQGERSFSGNVVLIPGDVPISITQVPGNNGGYSFSVAVDTVQLEKDEIKALTKRMKPYGAFALNRSKGLASINIGAMSRKKLFQKLDKAVEEVPHILHEFNILPQRECAYCKEMQCNAIAFVGEAPRPVHLVCNDNYIDEQVKQIEDNRQNGNYLVASLAALVGALIGTLPSLVSMVFADYIIAILFAAIPAASAFAYRRAGGVQNWFMPFVITLMSIAASVVLTFASLYFEFGAGTPVSEFMAIITHRRYRADVLALLGQVLLFGGIGIVCAWSLMTRTGKQKLRELQTRREQMLLKQESTSVEQEPKTAIQQEIK